LLAAHAGGVALGSAGNAWATTGKARTTGWARRYDVVCGAVRKMALCCPGRGGGSVAMASKLE